MQRLWTSAAAVTLGLALAGCASGGVGSPGAGTSIPAAPAAQMASSVHMASSAQMTPARGIAPSADGDLIQAVNAIGAPIRVLAEENASDQAAPKAAPVPGTCAQHVETFVPDRASDADSSELAVYYDAACQHIARDTVRIYASTGPDAENVTLAVKNYLPNGKQTSVRTTAVQLANATFNANGFPVAGDGFTREATSQLTVGSSRKTVLAGSEIIVGAPVDGTNAFCSDSAGYNSVGFKRLNETFGWSGSVAGGSRTANSDGSVSWTGTHTGIAVEGAPGSLALVTGAPNSACPITTAAYSIGGGTTLGGTKSTIAITLLQGEVKNLTVSGATLSGGYTANVVTSTTALPTSPAYITGSVKHDSTTLASFSVNAFGDGTLTLGNRGLKLVLVDWTVVE